MYKNKAIMDFTVTITQEELLEKWSEQISAGSWIKQYENLSNSYQSWGIDLILAEHIIKRVKEGYIDKYRDDEIPEVLRPLLLNAISDNIKKNNEENKNVSLKDVSGEAELEAIKRLRNYKSLDYNDVINLFCDGYDFANEYKEASTNLSDFSTEELLQEVKNRI